MSTVVNCFFYYQEGGKDKCFKYWPDCSSSKNTVEFGPVRRKLHPYSSLNIRDIPIKKTKTMSQKKMLSQF